MLRIDYVTMIANAFEHYPTYTVVSSTIRHSYINNGFVKESKIIIIKYISAIGKIEFSESLLMIMLGYMSSIWIHHFIILK